MKLLVDIGNTRVKWAMLGEQGLGAQQADAYASWTSQQVRERLLSCDTPPVAVLIANVGGAEIGELIGAAIRETWRIEPTFVHSTAVKCGVRNAYSQPQNLGVDRWLGVIAAYHYAHGAACVVSVGTAMTVDGVTQDGQHLGGVIVPGPDLMIASLMKNTSDIATRARDGNLGDRLFADNTLAAVHQGAAHALAALVERAALEMQAQLGATPALFVTGGASDRIERALRVSYRLMPDLVLQGLAVLARESST